MLRWRSQGTLPEVRSDRLGRVEHRVLCEPVSAVVRARMVRQLGDARAMSAIITREGRETDHGFVLNTWTRSLTEAFPPARRKRPDGSVVVPSSMLKPLMRHVLARATLHVACTNDDIDTLLGWVLHEDEDVWWIYVAWDYRRRRNPKAKVATVDLLRACVKSERSAA